MPKFDLDELGFAPGAESLFERKSQTNSQRVIPTMANQEEFIDLENPGSTTIIIPNYCEAFFSGQAVEMPAGVYCNNKTCSNREKISVTLPKHGRGYAPCNVQGILPQQI